MIKNVSQTLYVTATDIIANSWKNEKTTAILEKIKTETNAEVRESLKKQFTEGLTPESRSQFKTAGIELPTDKVGLTLCLGGFIFDIITPSIPKPTAPLRLAAYNKQIGDMAHKLMQPEFELTAEELELLKKVLDDDVLWGKVKVEADVGKSLSVPLTLSGLSHYNQIIDAAIKIFEPETQQTETNETNETNEETNEPNETKEIKKRGKKSKK